MGNAVTTHDVWAVLKWLALPLLGLVFACGGAYYKLNELDARLAAVEQSRAATHADRRLDNLEAAFKDHAVQAEGRHERTSRNVIAICVATEAACQ